MHKAVYLVVFVGVFGCGGPAEYRKGTYRPPPTPVMRPGVGAPSVGQPGWNPGVRTIPSPQHGRILPQTPETRKEPGIWASEPERASVEDPENPLTWKAFYYPENLDFREISVAQKCRAEFERAATSLDLTHDSIVKRLPQTLSIDQWQCFIAKAYQHCATEKHKANESARAKTLIGGPTNDPLFTLKNLKKTADLLDKARCIDELPKDARYALALVKQQLTEIQRGFSNPRN
jgi:hypothetical protein